MFGIGLLSVDAIEKHTIKKTNYNQNNGVESTVEKDRESKFPRVHCSPHHTLPKPFNISRTIQSIFHVFVCWWTLRWCKTSITINRQTIWYTPFASKLDKCIRSALWVYSRIPKMENILTKIAKLQPLWMHNVALFTEIPKMPHISTISRPPSLSVGVQCTHRSGQNCCWRCF